jgi:putative ABC transport system permease protein
MNNVTVLNADKAIYAQTIYGVDPEITRIFSFNFIEGDSHDFCLSDEIRIMLSSRAARQYGIERSSIGRKLKLVTYGDTVQARIAAVFNKFPSNSHIDYDFFIAFQPKAIAALNFRPERTGIYGRTTRHTKLQPLTTTEISTQTKSVYNFQPLPEIYFGPRVLGEEAQHGDRYSMIILICITSLILFLALAGFINLTTITLPYRSKEFAVKKLAGTSQANLAYEFLKESFTLVGISSLLGLLIVAASGDYIESMLGVQPFSLFTKGDVTPFLIVGLLIILLSLSPVVMLRRFVQASPTRLLSTDTITFPRLKRAITFFQLGISIFLIVTSVVVRRQINFSLIKEPGQNHDQVVYMNSPSGLSNAGVMRLRSGWKQSNPNILDVMAVSQLPDRVNSKEINSAFYLLQVDRGYREFFDLKMKQGNWFGPNTGDSIFITNEIGKAHLTGDQGNVLGIVEDINGQFNQPEKPMKISIAPDYNYNWLCVRLLEIDIRRTVKRLEEEFSDQGKPARVNYLNPHFNSWIDYQDRLNSLSGLLAVISALLSCCAIYGLSISLVRDKVKQIAVHKLLGARTAHIASLLVTEFAKQMAMAVIIFGPITYVFLSELLRTFVFATKFSWLDPVYPIAYCVFVILGICCFQAMSLNRTDFASILKS